MIRKSVVIVGVALGLTGISVANADQINPLHPAYFVGKAMVSERSGGDSTRYVDAGNPLHPVYGRGGEVGNWTLTAALMDDAYLDWHNPLSPRYKHF